MGAMTEAEIQDQINRAVAEGEVALAELRAQGLSDDEVRDVWLLFSGIAPEDLPHGHDESD